MARRGVGAGTVIPPKGRRRSWAVRFKAYGKRHFVTLGRPEDGWNRQRADAELRHILADAERGIWKPYDPPAIQIPQEMPVFEEFAAEWLAINSSGWRDFTLAHYNWALKSHLLPFFGQHRLVEITVQEVDRYRSWKATQPIRRGGASETTKRNAPLLSARSINNTIRALSTILELAVDYGYLQSNPARGRKRLLKESKPPRSYLQPVQVRALLRAAEQMDREASGRDNRRRQALLATLALAGLRIGEALDLRWRDVDPSGRWLRVNQAKTDTGVRRVDLTPTLRTLLLVYRDQTPHASQDDRVFPTKKGKRDNPSNIRNRLIRRAVEQANEELQEVGHQAIGRISPHSLRRTYISLALAAGADVPYVMKQAGHSDPRMTLSVYAGVIASGTDHGAAVDNLIGAL
jgi:integrase